LSYLKHLNLSKKSSGKKENKKQNFENSKKINSYQRIRIIVPKTLPFIIIIMLLAIIIFGVFIIKSNITGEAILISNPKIIFLSGAEQLNSDKLVISDIYERVKSQDDNWKIIKPSEFIRVSFEYNLGNRNDLSIYAKSISNSPARINVYRKGDNQPIAIFTDISEQGYYKVYLSGLNKNEITNTFDLEILDNSIEFDYIFDP
jgi:hypothetical protein